MKYIIESKSFQIVNKLINLIKAKSDVMDENFLVFDYEQDNGLQEAYNQFLSTDLFETNKLIVLKNFTLINEEKPSKARLSILNDIINTESDNTIILTIDKIKKTKSQWKKVSSSLEHLSQDVPKGNDLNNFIKKYFNKYGIEYDASVVNLIIDRTDGNFDILINELSKLQLLNTQITSKVASETVYVYKKESIFKLIETLFSNNPENIENVMKSLSANGMTYITMLQFLISDLTLILQVKLHIENNSYFDRNKISEETGINSYRLLKANEKAQKLSKESLYKLLEEVINLESGLMINNPEDSELIIRTKLLSSKI